MNFRQYWEIEYRAIITRAIPFFILIWLQVVICIGIFAGDLYEGYQKMTHRIVEFKLDEKTNGHR